MKLNTIEEVDEFLITVGKCKKEVWLESPEGDKINLKSKLSQYIALGALLSHQEDLELFCSSSDDEALFYKYFRDNPGSL